MIRCLNLDFLQVRDPLILQFTGCVFNIKSMSDNEVKELFGYLSKEGEVSADKVKQLFSSVYREAKPVGPASGTVSRSDF